mgnify:CR=1 FL=1
MAYSSAIARAQHTKLCAQDTGRLLALATRINRATGGLRQCLHALAVLLPCVHQCTQGRRHADHTRMHPARESSYALDITRYPAPPKRSAETNGSAASVQGRMLRMVSLLPAEGCAQQSERQRAARHAVPSLWRAGRGGGRHHSQAAATSSAKLAPHEGGAHAQHAASGSLHCLHPSHAFRSPRARAPRRIARQLK